MHQTHTIGLIINSRQLGNGIKNSRIGKIRLIILGIISEGE